MLAEWIKAGVKEKSLGTKMKVGIAAINEFLVEKRRRRPITKRYEKIKG